MLSKLFSFVRNGISAAVVGGFEDAFKQLQTGKEYTIPVGVEGGNVPPALEGAVVNVALNDKEPEPEPEEPAKTKKKTK